MAKLRREEFKINKKIIIGGIVIILIAFVLVKYVIADINGSLKAPEVIKITNEYLNKTYPKERCAIINGPNRSLSFGTYDVKVKNKDNLIFTIKIRDNLKLMEDLRMEEYLNNEFNTFLQSEYKSKIQKISSTIQADVVMSSKYLDRNDTVYINIIDTQDVAKQNFAAIALRALDWINTKGYNLDILYLDYMHKENGDYVYSLKVDSNNCMKKDLTPYIKDMTTDTSK